MKRIKLFVITMLASATLAGGVMSPLVLAAPAADPIDPSTSIQNGVNDSGGKGATSLGVRLKRVVNVLLYIIGAIAVIMVVIGGLRYVLSGGDSAQLKGAKDTILYSVVGIIVAILAYAIVNFAITSFK